MYPPVIGLARTAFVVLGLRIKRTGKKNIPRRGGAVMAINHIGYPDFIFAGLVARPRRRLVRFMAKESVFRHPVSGPLMRGMKHIPVDRDAGASAFGAAVTALRNGEIVGVFPEATISRSYMLKDFKTGAARMAQAAGVPIIPVTIWGSHRVYTKGRKPDLRWGKRILIAAGEPFTPDPAADPADVTAELRKRMTEMLAEQQRTYGQKPRNEADRWWLPAELGGTAPTPEEAAAMDAADRRKRSGGSAGTDGPAATGTDG